jgi:hypothetical protein
MDYRVHYLTSCKVDQAYPLMQLAVPDLTLERWRAFAARHVVPEQDRLDPASPPVAGVVVAEDRGGYIHGLFRYAVEDDLLSRCLNIRDFLACSLFGGEEVADALLARIEHIAKLLDCSAIHSDLPKPRTVALDCASAQQFSRRGFRPHTLRMSRPSRAADALASGARLNSPKQA